MDQVFILTTPRVEMDSTRILEACEEALNQGLSHYSGEPAPKRTFAHVNVQAATISHDVVVVVKLQGIMSHGNRMTRSEAIVALLKKSLGATLSIHIQIDSEMGVDVGDTNRTIRDKVRSAGE